MPEAPFMPDERRRLAAVHKTRLLGTPAEERFDRITRIAQQLFDVPMACIDIVGEKLAWLKSVQGFDGVEGLRRDSYCHYTVLSEDVMLVTDARCDPRVHDSALAESWVFYAGTPLHFDGARVGVLCIGDNKPRDFRPEQMRSLSDLGVMAEHEFSVAALSEAQVRLAASNEELEMKARIDVLTHLWNRGAIMELAETELAAGTGAPSAVLMIDVDHFKSINDRFGHPAGDQVLRIVAATLRAGLRPMDAVGRYGGEEFLAVLSNLGLEEALQAAERLRQDVSSALVQFEQHMIAVTCSIGIAMAADQESLSALIGRADHALYRAKASGRNCVEVEMAAVAGA
jgi:diguanylate cyclase (GGDEF)-like protein